VTDEPDPDRFITSAAAEDARRHPVVVTLPEDLTAEQLSTIPNPPTERTATALMAFQQSTADAAMMPSEVLVQMDGSVGAHGLVGLYEQLGRPGSRDVVQWIVSWQFEGDPDLELFATEAEETARAVYAETLDRVNGTGGDADA
jgi:hypothetical protein